MENIYKVVCLGTGNYGDVFCKVQIKEGELTISGVEGPYKNGNAKGGCGQIYDSINIKKFTDHWDKYKVSLFISIWKKYHLNHMNSACKHQKQLGWTYETHREKTGFNGLRCPICNYKIGSAWLKEELPKRIIDYIKSLPETKKEYAWV